MQVMGDTDKYKKLRRLQLTGDRRQQMLSSWLLNCPRGSVGPPKVILRTDSTVGRLFETIWCEFVWHKSRRDQCIPSELPLTCREIDARMLGFDAPCLVCLLLLWELSWCFHQSSQDGSGRLLGHTGEGRLSVSPRREVEYGVCGISPFNLALIPEGRFQGLSSKHPLTQVSPREPLQGNRKGVLVSIKDDTD